MDQSVVAFYRYSHEKARSCIVVANLTPVIRNNYRIGVDRAGEYRELINTDMEIFGGSGQHNEAYNLQAQAIEQHDRPAALSLTLPPLAVLILEYAGLDTRS